MARFFSESRTAHRVEGFWTLWSIGFNISIGFAAGTLGSRGLGMMAIVVRIVGLSAKLAKDIMMIY